MHSSREYHLAGQEFRQSIKPLTRCRSISSPHLVHRLKVLFDPSLVEDFTRTLTAGTLRELIDLRQGHFVHGLVHLYVNFGDDAGCRPAMSELSSRLRSSFIKAVSFNLGIVPLAVKVDEPSFAGRHGDSVTFSPSLRHAKMAA